MVAETLALRFEQAKAGCVGEMFEREHLKMSLYVFSEKPDTTMFTFCDFDGAIYQLSNPMKDEKKVDKTKIRLSIQLKFYQQLQEYGADEVQCT